MRVNQESGKGGSKLNIPKINLMASSCTTSWQTDGGKVEAVTDFIFLGSEITVDSNCSHDIQRRLLLGRKAMTIRQLIKKERHHFTDKGHIVKAMVFPVATYECETWTIKKVEHQRIDAFDLWCWRRLLRVLWAARRSKQSILNEINPKHSLEGLMLKLKLQYFAHLMQRAETDPDAGKD